MRKILPVVVIVAIVALSSVALRSQTETEHPLAAELTANAKAFLIAQNEVLVEGSSQAAANPALNRVRAELTAQSLKRRSDLGAVGLRYTSFTTKLTPRRVEQDGITATLEVIESTEFRLASTGDPETPETSQYQEGHRFFFVYWNGVWEIERDEIIQFEPLPQEPQAPETARDVPLAGVRRLQPTLDRAAIVNYARRYANSPNKAYHFFTDNDCANFASQALLAGRWTQVTDPWLPRRSDMTFLHLWFYDGRYFSSNTWTVADSLYRFTVSRPRGSFIGSLQNLLPGDLVFADWQRDGKIDHAMIVTKKDTRTVYLTYHSGPAVDRAVAEVTNRERANNPNHSNPFYYGIQLDAIIK